MRLDKPMETIVKRLPPPPKGLHYAGLIDTHESVPGIYVTVMHKDYTIFGSFIPFMDVFYLQYPPTEDEEGIYYNFQSTGVETLTLPSESIHELVTESIEDLAQSFQALFDIIIPLTEDEEDE